MKNIKKLCVFCALFLITLLFNIKNTKADTIAMLDYENANNTSTRQEIYSGIKEYIDNNNTNNYNYIIGYGTNGYNVFVQKNDASRKVDKIYISSWLRKDSNKVDRLAQALIFHTETSYPNYFYITYISESDWRNNTNNKTTFLNNINKALHGTGLSSGLVIFNAGYRLINNTETINYVNDWIEYYYSTIPLYYIGKKSYLSSFFNNNTTLPSNGSDSTNQSIETICNNNDFTITNDKNLELYYSTGTYDIALSCGDIYPTYLEYEESIPQYTEQEEYTNIDKQIQSLDIYYNTNTTKTYEEEFKLEYTLNQGGSNAYEVTGYKVYGKQCNYLNNSNINATCWWEEINNSYWTIDNDTYKTEENNYTIDFKFNINVSNTNYEDIKLAIIQMPSNFNLTISTKNENKKYNSIDLNTMYYDYCKETITNNLIDTKNLGILVDNKPGETNIEYRFYTKRRIKEYDEIYFYYFNKIRNEIGETQIQTFIYETYKIGETLYYIETGTINLGTNSNNKLFIFTNEYRSAKYDIYFNTKVYYTKQDNILNNIEVNYTGTDGTIQTTIDTRVNNDFIQQEYENSTSVNFDNIIEMIESYEQYKNEWLELFYSIYRPLPTIIKQILILMYFMAHCYGIYLIFKD